MKARDFVNPELDRSTPLSEKYGLTKDRATELYQMVTAATLVKSQELREMPTGEERDKKCELFFGNPSAFAAASIADIEVDGTNELLFVFTRAEELLTRYHHQRDGNGLGELVSEIRDIMLKRKEETSHD